MTLIPTESEQTSAAEAELERRVLAVVREAGPDELRLIIALAMAAWSVGRLASWWSTLRLRIRV